MHAMHPTPRYVRAAERGAVVIIAYFCLVLMLFITFGFIDLGFQNIDRLEAHNTSEAAALAQAYNVMAIKAPGYGGKLSADQVEKDNFAQNQPTTGVTQRRVYDNPTPPIAFPLRWSDSGGAEAVVTAKARDADAFKTPLSFLGTMLRLEHPPTLGGDAIAVVDQVLWNKSKIVPPRMVFVIDYSWSMNSPTDDENGVTRFDKDHVAVNVMLRAFKHVLDFAKKDHINVGFVPFAHVALTAGEIRPLDEPADGEINLIENQVDKVWRAAKSFALEKHSTDMQRAAAEGLRIVSSTAGGKTIAKTDVKYGKQILVFITDGQPDLPDVGNADYDKNWNVGQNAASKYVEGPVWADGVDTVSILISHHITKATNLSEDSVETFMRSLGGSDGKVDPRNYYEDEGKEKGIDNFLADYADRLKTRCNLESFRVPATSWMLQPNARGHVFVHQAPQNSRFNEKTLLRLFSLQAVDASTKEAFWYAAADDIIRLSDPVCKPIARNRLKPVFRARYGQPRLVNTNATAWAR